jgi:hypothetical protein
LLLHGAGRSRSALNVRLHDDRLLLIFIYRTTRADLEPDEGALLGELEAISEVSVEEVEVSAVVGDLAGTAMSILTSPEATALATLIQIGTPLWILVRKLRSRNRSVVVDKIGARALAAAAVSDEVRKDPPDRSINEAFGLAKIWGPMEAEPIVGFSADWFVNDGASIPSAHFTAIAVPWHRNRVRTYWYVISDGGELCSAWWTQTMRERVPDFLRPNAV